MSRSRSISEQIHEMQKANDQLKRWEKLFDKACKLRFGISAKEIEIMLQNIRSSSDEK